MVELFVEELASRITNCFPGDRNLALDWQYQSDDESELGLQTLWLQPKPGGASPHLNVLDVKAMQQLFERVYRLTLSTAPEGIPQVAIHGRFAEEEMMVILATQSAAPSD